MLFKYTTLPMLVMILSTSFQLAAMEGGPKTDQLTQTFQGARGSLEVEEPRQPHTVKATSYAFASNLPEGVTLRSKYIKNPDSQSQCITSLASLPLVKKTSTKANGNTTETTTEYELDARELDELYKIAVLEIERPGIVEATQKAEQAKLSVFQKYPFKFALVSLAIGASLPYVVPLLIEKYNSFEQ